MTASGKSSFQQKYHYISLQLKFVDLPDLEKATFVLKSSGKKKHMNTIESCEYL